MISFKVKDHFEFTINNQGINLTDFIFKASETDSEDQILHCFIRSTHLTQDSLPNAVKCTQEKHRFLRQAFDVEKMDVANFKKLNKDEIISFLTDYLKDPNWCEDKNDFVELLNKYLSIISNIDSAQFYLIDKDWFAKNSILIEPEKWIYIYYFLIIFLDNTSKTLSFSEWTYD